MGPAGAKTKEVVAEDAKVGRLYGRGLASAGEQIAGPNSGPPLTSDRKRARSGRRRLSPRRPAHQARPTPRLAARRERAESGGGPAPATKRRRSRREKVRAAAAVAAAVPRSACGPPPRRRQLPAARRPTPADRAGSHGGSERAAGPLPYGWPGRRPGGHGMRRGRRAALPDRAEVSARGQCGLGPAPPPPAGSPPPAALYPQRVPGPHGVSLPEPGEAAALRWAPGLCVHVLRRALHAPNPQRKTGFGILIQKRLRSGLGILGVRGGREQPARGLQTSSPRETCAA